MSSELPIYAEPPLRTGLQFAQLDKLKGHDDAEVWRRADTVLAAMEGAADIAAAREAATAISQESMLRAHAAAFAGRAGAGRLRQSAVTPIYRGQDCAPPEFIENSLANLVSWLTADSFSQIHPIERCALTITRIVDIWPFEFGNTTVALIWGNRALRQAGLTPFFVPAEHGREFDRVLAQAMTIDMQPLVHVIFQTVHREMEALAR